MMLPEGLQRRAVVETSTGSTGTHALCTATSTTSWSRGSTARSGASGHVQSATRDVRSHSRQAEDVLSATFARHLHVGAHSQDSRLVPEGGTTCFPMRPNVWGKLAGMDSSMEMRPVGQPVIRNFSRRQTADPSAVCDLCGCRSACRTP